MQPRPGRAVQRQRLGRQGGGAGVGDDGGGRRQLVQRLQHRLALRQIRFRCQQVLAQPTDLCRVVCFGFLQRDHAELVFGFAQLLLGLREPGAQTVGLLLEKLVIAAGGAMDFRVAFEIRFDDRRQHRLNQFGIAVLKRNLNHRATRQRFRRQAAENDARGALAVVGTARILEQLLRAERVHDLLRQIPTGQDQDFGVHDVFGGRRHRARLVSQWIDAPAFEDVPNQQPRLGLIAFGADDVHARRRENAEQRAADDFPFLAKQDLVHIPDVPFRAGRGFRFWIHGTLFGWRSYDYATCL